MPFGVSVMNLNPIKYLVIPMRGRKELRVVLQTIDCVKAHRIQWNQTGIWLSAIRMSIWREVQ